MARKHPDLEAGFLSAWKLSPASVTHTMPTQQHEFAKHIGRKWRWDFSWPHLMVSVEIMGGTWMRGGHSRGAGQQRDFEKQNAAVTMGWSVLLYTTDDITKRPMQVIDEVVALLDLAKIQGSTVHRGDSDIR